MMDPAGSPRGGPRISNSLLPLIAIAFVIVSLLVLTIGPGLTGLRLDALRAKTDSTSGRGQQVLAELNLLLLQDVVEHQSLRLTGTAASVERYRAVRVAEDAKFRELITLARRVGLPATVDHAVAMARLAQRWHELPDARAIGRIDDSVFAANLPLVAARRDSIFAAYHELTDDFRDAAARDEASGGVLIRRERGVSLTIGGLALVSVLALLWVARRDRLLTRELERALDEEARLRVESEARRKDIEQVTESKSRLIRGFSHDVKNPLGAADGFLQLLEDGIMGPLTEQQLRAVARARTLIASALSLIGDLLELGRAETGRLEVRREPVDLSRIVTELVEEYRPLAEQKLLRLAIEPEARPAFAESDPVRVRQVLGNLLSNAVKYTARGEVTIRIQPPHLEENGNGRRIAVAVADTGTGIPSEKRGLLFQEFVRLDPSSAPGAGVGLAISHRIAQALDGDITVDSSVGKGSTFTLWLPAIADHGAPVLPHAAS